MTFALVRRIGSAALILCTLAAPAWSQNEAAAKPPSPEHIALARAVLDFTGARRSFDAVLPKLLQDARSVILRTRPTLQVDLDPAIIEVAKQMRTADEELVGEIALIYARNFSETELKDIAAFYQSPAGQKMAKELPNILAESYKQMQDWSRKLSVDVMNNIRAEMKKKGHEI